MDKTTLALPGRQDELVRAVAAAARRTVVVINSATPVLMPWLDDVDAVLWIGLPGQEGGHAVADVLLGTRRADRPAGHHFPGRRRRRSGLDRHAEGRRAGLLRRAPGSATAVGTDPAVEPAFWFGAGLGWGAGSTLGRVQRASMTPS